MDIKNINGKTLFGGVGDLQAVLELAVLSGAKLSGAKLSGAKLSGAKLSEADLSEADLSEADLREADLLGAILSGADLRGADLREADLRGAKLSEAKLGEADLRGADLREADLNEAILSGAELSEETPVVPQLHRRILAAIDAGGKLEMAAWHTCATTHCRAGWAIRLAGQPGADLEARLGPAVAGALITMASAPYLERVPDFVASNEAAMESIAACARTEALLAE